MNSYEQRIASIIRRQYPNLTKEEAISNFCQRSFENLICDSALPQTDCQRYVKAAMEQVDSKYTKETKDAGEAVKKHIEHDISRVDFEYQGSVMTNTHIKGYSDIDLLIFSNRFFIFNKANAKRIIESGSASGYTYNEIQKIEAVYNKPSYNGTSREELQTLRHNCEITLKNAYEDVDTSKPKAIRIRNKNIDRKVDIVIAAWHYSIDYIIHNRKIFRGVKIYNNQTCELEGPDYPFYSIYRINKRGEDTCERLKRMIRFLKNIKEEIGNIQHLTSFDINALCYSIPPESYKDKNFIELSKVLASYIYCLLKDTAKLHLIKSVDGKEYIFRDQQNKQKDMEIIYQFLYSVIQDLNK